MTVSLVSCCVFVYNKTKKENIILNDQPIQRLSSVETYEIKRGDSAYAVLGFLGKKASSIVDVCSEEVTQNPAIIPMHFHCHYDITAHSLCNAD